MTAWALPATLGLASAGLPHMLGAVRVLAALLALTACAVAAGVACLKELLLVRARPLIVEIEV